MSLASGLVTIAAFLFAAGAFATCLVLGGSRYRMARRGPKTLWATLLGVGAGLSFFGVDVGKALALLSAVAFLGWALPALTRASRPLAEPTEPEPPALLDTVAGAASGGAPETLKTPGRPVVQTARSWALQRPMSAAANVVALPLSACVSALPLRPLLGFAKNSAETDVLRDQMQGINRAADYSGLTWLVAVYFVALVGVAFLFALRPLRSASNDSAADRLLRNLAIPAQIWLLPLRWLSLRLGRIGGVLWIAVLTFGFFLNRPEIWSNLQGEGGMRAATWVMVGLIVLTLAVAGTAQYTPWANQHSYGTKVEFDLKWWAGAVPMILLGGLYLVIKGSAALVALIAAPLLNVWVWATYEFPGAMGWFRSLTWPLDGREPTLPDGSGRWTPDYSLTDWSTLASPIGFGLLLVIYFVLPVLVGRVALGREGTP